MNLYKIGTKILFLVVIFFCIFSISITKASALDTIFQKIDNIIIFIDSNITEQIRREFCIQYFFAVSNGQWKEGEFRVLFGNKVCVGKEKEYLTLVKEEKIGIESTTTPIITEKNIVTKNKLLPQPLVDSESPNDSLILNDGQIIYWTNIERNKNATNLTQLKSSDSLTKIAKGRVDDMFAKTYFEHVSPTGDSASKLAEKNNYKYIIIGENIALGNFGSSREIVQAWMDSEGHRANILNKNYTEIGVYSREGEYKGKKVWISAQIFSKPMSFCVEPNNSNKATIEKNNDALSVVKINLKKVEGELKVASTSDVVKYNEKVSEYNNLAHIFNNLASNIKDSTTLYNKEVQSFNECIKIN
ncbi:MAG: CAP domain-containing protein [Candidatus Paceibacterota bacterium]|jgi:uncharacterized protein YkwD